MNRKGFTLIEIMLVVVIIGLMLAVIIPRAQRASRDTKHAVVRQAATELGGKADSWSDQEASMGIQSKHESLGDLSSTSGMGVGNSAWDPIWKTIDADQPLVNPFNGVNYADQSFSNRDEGEIAMVSLESGGPTTFAMLWIGPHETADGDGQTWYGGQNTDSVDGLRHGVIVATVEDPN